MKIDSILLENFGLYGGRRFRFDGQPLILIYGANESGKTTALNGLRQALFGFPHNSAYLTGKPMSAEVTVSLSDGRIVRFTRQKKRAEGFTATIEGKIPLSENQWQELSGGLDLKTYQSLFGFSLEELRSGEKALAHAPLSEALSGSGFGGLARLQQVQARIDGFLTATLKRNGSGGAINAKLAEIESAEKQLESVLTLPSDVAELRQQLATATETVDQLGTRLKDLRIEFESCQRKQAALPRAIEYRQVEESLKAYEIPAAIDEEFRLQWTVTQNRLAGARTELSAEQRKLAELQRTFDALPITAGSTPNQDEIRRLGAEAQQIAQLRRQVSDDTREADELDRELSESLRRLGLSKRDDHWKSIQLDLTQRAELDGARQLSESLVTRLAACETRLEVAGEQLRKHSVSRDAEALPENLQQLETLLREAQPILQNCDQLLVRLNELRDDRVAVARADRLRLATQKLAASAAGADIVLSIDWSVPSNADVAKHQLHFAQATAHLERLASELETCTRQCAELQQEFSKSQAALGLTSVADLQALWQERDRIIGEWQEELQTPLLAANVSPREHAQRLTQIAELNARSDSAVRALLAAADRVALLVSKQQQLTSLQARHTTLTQQLTHAKENLSNIGALWQELWCGCPIAPESPDQLGSWLDDYRSWCDQQATIERLVSEHRKTSAMRDAALEELLENWPQKLAACSSFVEAEQHIQQWREVAAKAALQARILSELTTAHAVAKKDYDELQRQVNQCQQHYLQTVCALHLPDCWPIHEISSRLDACMRCQTTAGRIEKIRQRVHAVQTRIDNFVRAVTQQARLSGVEIESAQAERHAQLWLDQMQQDERIDKQRVDLTATIAVHTQTISKRQSQLSEYERTLKALADSVGANTFDEVQGWISSANTVFQLRSRQAQLAAALDANAAEVPLPTFLSELATLNPRSVTAATASLSAQVSSTEASRQTAIQHLGALTRELEFKEQGSAAMECEQRLKRLRSELVDLSEQWVVHRLAGELLERTIDRFTRDHEPQLIKHTRRFFRELTDDRYCVVEHDSGKHGGFAVRDQQGHAWQPDKLSTGTREQLYLAIRLAFITHFNEHHEPLPVIMDDCFVNFDDTRARIALRTLIHWQESVQTILLSCHWRSVEALAELAPETPVITIANGEVTTARQLSERSDDYAAATPIARLPI